jgi:cytochrome P450
MTTADTADATAGSPSGEPASAPLAPVPASSGRPKPFRPPWRDLVPLMRAFNTDILGALTLVRDKYGDFVRTRLPLHIYFVSEPRAIEEILLKKADSFRKDHTSRLLSRVVGNGLLVSEGETWRRQRRLMQPAFHHQQLQSYAALMVGAIERAMGGWSGGEARDVHADMMAVTLDIVAGSLFDTDVSAAAGEIGRIIGDLMEQFGKVLGLSGRFQPPAWVPTPTNLRLRRTRRRIYALILDVIEARKRSGETRDDLLSLLIRARDEAGGQMSDDQVRDEAILLFLAGHETTALALTYALYLLATHPDAQARLAEELGRVLGGRSPGLGDLDKLAFTEAVVLESMRLYPPAWGMARESTGPVEIAGYSFPKGATFVMSPWVLHRDPRNFDDPATFKPERWQNDLQRRLPRFAYFPFGGGPRICIGNRFAMMEAKLVLAAAMQRFRFDPTPETAIALFPSVTLRPRGGVRLRVSERAR